MPATFLILCHFSWISSRLNTDQSINNHRIWWFINLTLVLIIVSQWFLKPWLLDWQPIPGLAEESRTTDIQLWLLPVLVLILIRMTSSRQSGEGNNEVSHVPGEIYLLYSTMTTSIHVPILSSKVLLVVKIINSSLSCSSTLTWLN